MEKMKSLFEKIEYEIGYSLPNEFQETYLNLQEKNINLMSLEEIYYEVISEFSEHEDPELYESEPANAILLKAFDKKRVPFIKDDSGNFIGMDFNPGTEGVIGQIINYGCDENYMKVFAYSFKDFIDGIRKCNISEDIYITDYLLDNNISFISEKKIDTSIVKLENKNLKEIKEANIIENIKEENIQIENLQEIIQILSEMNSEIMKDKNVKKFKNYWFNYRIINKKDSLSRTMMDKESFFKKLENYNKDEIKGFSFAISNYIEEIKDQNILAGEEKIFVEINILSKKILIRYTETIGDLNMKAAYDKINNYIDTI